MRPCVGALILAGVLFITGISPAMAAEEFYVSTSGSDDWSGTLPEPNDPGTDGPFATLEKAREAVRNSGSSDGATVYLRGGIYSLGETFTLTEEDSGSENAPVVWTSYPNETARLVGGVFVNTFEEVTNEVIRGRFYEDARDHILQADLKALGFTTFNGITQSGGPGMALYYEAEPMTLSRYPNDEWFNINQVPITCDEPIAGDTRTEAFHCGHFTYRVWYTPTSQFLHLPDWVNDGNIWMFGYWYWDWSSTYQKVESIDNTTHDIVMSPPYHYYGYKPGQRYYFLNILEEVDMPGEWYLDFNSGMLYFYPPGNIGTDDVFISSMNTSMIHCDGASNVTIKDILIEGSQGQAVQVDNGENVVVDGCEVRNINSSYAIDVRSGTGHTVMNCHIYNIGGGGITVLGGDRATLTPGHMSVVNNEIHDFGLVYRTYHGGARVSGVENTVAHNKIYNAPHLGISFSGNEHIIEYNEVFDVAQETHDVGALYNGRDWTQRGTIIRYNYIHDNEYAEAVYLDDFLSGHIIYGNVLYNNSLGILIGGGRDNVVENNIFIENGSNIHVDGRGIGWASYYIDSTMSNFQSTLFDRMDAMNYSQPPYSERYPVLLSLYDDDPGLPKHNVFHRNILFGGNNWSIGNDVDDLLERSSNLEGVDPLFVDYEGHNFQLTAESPAYSQIGFEQIPFEEMGLIGGSTPVMIKSEAPVPFELAQNSPNPFNPTTTISFTLPERAMTKLNVYNALGQEVRSLVDSRLSAGTHSVVFDGTELSSGIYFYRLECGETAVSRKMLLMK